MNPLADPLPGVLRDVAYTGAILFLDTHLREASPAARLQVGQTLQEIIETSVIAYLDIVAQIAQSN
jgi:hypothetical protein